MDIQRGEKENPPNPSHHPKANFFWLPSSRWSGVSKMEQCPEVSNPNAKNPIKKILIYDVSARPR